MKIRTFFVILVLGNHLDGSFITVSGWMPISILPITKGLHRVGMLATCYPMCHFLCCRVCGYARDAHSHNHLRRYWRRDSTSHISFLRAILDHRAKIHGVQRKLSCRECLVKHMPYYCRFIPANLRIFGQSRPPPLEPINQSATP